MPFFIIEDVYWFCSFQYVMFRKIAWAKISTEKQDTNINQQHMIYGNPLFFALLTMQNGFLKLLATEELHQDWSWHIITAFCSMPLMSILLICKRAILRSRFHLYLSGTAPAWWWIWKTLILRLVKEEDLYGQQNSSCLVLFVIYVIDITWSIMLMEELYWGQ